MKLKVCYSERVFYEDDVIFTDEQVKEMLDEVGIPENEREELFSDLEKLFEAVRNSQIFYDYLSDSFTFNIVDSDIFEYDRIYVVREEEE